MQGQGLAVLECTGSANMAGTVTNAGGLGNSTTYDYGIGSGGTAIGTGYYWPFTPTYLPYPTWPSTYFYSTLVSEDKGKKAFDLAQSLVEKKLVEAKSAKQFIELMNAILAVL